MEVFPFSKYVQVCAKADKSEIICVFVQCLAKIVEDVESAKQNTVWMTVIVCKLEVQR